MKEQRLERPLGQERIYGRDSRILRWEGREMGEHSDSSLDLHTPLP